MLQPVNKLNNPGAKKPLLTAIRQQALPLIPPEHKDRNPIPLHHLIHQTTISHPIILPQTDKTN
jgi:hypothetical protein